VAASTLTDLRAVAGPPAPTDQPARDPRRREPEPNISFPRSPGHEAETLARADFVCALDPGELTVDK